MNKYIEFEIYSFALMIIFISLFTGFFMSQDVKYYDFIFTSFKLLAIVSIFVFITAHVIRKVKK